MTGPAWRQPRIAAAIVERLLPERDRADLLLDLEELYAIRRDADGRKAADRWFWRQALQSVARFGWAEALRRLEESSRRDVAVAMRGLRREWRFAAAAVAILAVGIGANVAVWTGVEQLVLRPLGFADEERLVRVWPEHHFTGARFVEFRDTTRSFDGFTAFSPSAVPSFEADRPAVLRALRVSAGHFELFGMEPVLGRGFGREDERSGAEPVVVLGHGVWQTRYGGDRSILGRQLRLDVTRTVVGVAPAGFRPRGREVDVWVPIALDPESDDYTHMASLDVAARLAHGVSAEAARADMETLGLALEPPLYTRDEVPSYTVASYRDDLVGSVSPVLTLLAAATTLVLLLCCVNISNLLLGRAAARDSELALRRALGASRLRVGRQLMTESLVLGAAAGVVGLVLVQLSAGYWLAWVPESVPRRAELGLGRSAAGWTVALSLAASCLFGLVPALRGSRSSSAITRGARGGTGERRASGILIAAEVAMALVLLTASAHLVESFRRLEDVDAGFDRGRVVSMRLTPSPLQLTEPARKLAYYESVREALLAHPGVSDVGAIQILPLTNGFMGVGYSPSGAPIPQGQAPPMASYRVVTPGYRAALGAPLIAGRDLTSADRAGGRPVGLVNESLARTLSTSGDVVGSEVRYENGETWFEIVGVVGDVRHRLDAEAQPEVYVPLSQDSWPESMFVVARLGEAAVPYSALREAVWSVDPTVPITRLEGLESVVHDSIEGPRRRTAVFAAFALLALVLSAVGVYGVVSYAVEQRAREVGIRVALGATRGRVLLDVLRQGAGPIAAGVVAGAALSVLAARAMAFDRFLFDRSFVDLRVCAAAALLLSGVALLAAFLPARRAASSDPVRAIASDA